MLREDDGIAVGSEGADSRGRTHCRFCDASLDLPSPALASGTGCEG